jgi:hypothetical protein
MPPSGPFPCRQDVDQIKSIWINNFEAIVRGNEIVEYRVNAHITFEVK